MISSIKNISKLYTQCRKYTKSTLNQKPILYADEVSPPARFVMMTASLLKIELEIRNVDLFKGEHKTEEYRKINPLQKVPALVVEDKTILDSHAAAIYLCEQVVNQDLYPSDPFLRAKVNEMLFYNSSTVFRLNSEIVCQYFSGKWPVADNLVKEWYRALDYLDEKLNKYGWLAGNKMYLCDLCIMLSMTSTTHFLPITDTYMNINRWFNQFDKLPCIEINKRGFDRYKYFVELYKPNE